MEITQRTTKTAPEVSCWATSTDLAGSNFERKVYFLIIRDGDKEHNVTLTVKPGEFSVAADWYRVADYSYTIHDGCDHDNDKCVLDNPNFEEDEYGPQPGEIYQEVRKEVLEAQKKGVQS